MARPSGSAGGGAGGKKEDESAKHMFDRIGKEVYDEIVKKDVGAEAYKEALKGKLQKAASTISELAGITDTCKRVQKYYEHFNVGAARGKRYPCTNLKRNTNEERFSNTLGGQCTNKKMKCSNGEGACAPYRRLHLCHHNLETIETTSKTSTDTLLAEVCMAAYYEGESLTRQHVKHKLTNSDVNINICTVLARSFADIGDIVRGKDLFYGNTYESTQRKVLDDNLKTIFENIKKSDTKLTKLNDEQIREYWWEANRETVWKAITCSDDLKNSSYFRTTACAGTRTNDKCRCTKSSGAKVDDQVPTYFDYVPQYLRWFEEWAEDFCRKKNKKIKDVKTNCRDEKEKYCSGNGYDCRKTIYKKGKLVIGEHCTNCSVWCRLYEKWIDNQKKEFLKQKNKYTKEMKKYKNGESRSGSDGNKYDGYESKFYKILKGGYEKVNNFLELLNEEKECKGISEVKEKIDFKTVDNGFDKNINSPGTFYHSEYCKPCPGCGVKLEDNVWKEKKGGTCDRRKLYTTITNAESTNIDVLSFGDKREDRETKLKAFCPKTNGDTTNGVHGSGDCGGTNSDPSLCEKWKCYKHEHVQKVKNGEDDDDDDDVDGNYVKNGGGLCILPNPKKKEEEKTKKSEKEPDEFQKTFNEFFYFWIGRFLNDSMYWRGKVGGCLKNKSEKCKNECNTKCDCFLKWITQKKTEWDKIVQHFKKQDFGPQVENGGSGMLGGLMSCPDFVLKTVLKLEDLFENIKSGYGNVKETEGINKILDEEQKKNKEEADDGVGGGGIDFAAFAVSCTEDGVAKQNTTIDKLLNQEDKDATECKKCEEQAARARSAETNDEPPGSPPRSEEVESEEEEEEEEEDEDHGPDDEEAKTAEGAGEGEGAEAPKEVVPGPKDAEVPAATTTTQNDVKVCKTVAEALKTSLTDACTLKYVTGKNYGWKCIPTSGGDKTATSEGSSESGRRIAKRSVETSGSSGGSGATGKSDGSICIPPRRRKLYLGGFKRLTDGTSVSSEPTTATSSPSPKGDSLLTAFVESAAVETFFLWHKYKAENTKTQSESLLLPPQPVPVVDNDNPQNQLLSGKIPPDFLRQMFYTLGDYRDILFSGSKDEKSSTYNDILKGDKEMKAKEEKIKEKITSFFQNGDSQPPNGKHVTQTSDKTPQQTWWQAHGPDIWNGMVCALTYKEDTSGAKGESAKIEQDNEVETKLKEKLQKDKDYHYDTVTLKDEQSGGDSTLNNPKLKNFVEIPTYFRYLHEWGQNFCKERKKRLQKIEGDCRVEDGSKNCSGYGEDCKDNLLNKPYDTLPSFNCRSCGIECRKYKNWIKGKRKEFEEQKQEYSKQKTDAEGNNNGNEFYTKLEECPEVKDFLQKLEPCKKDNGEGKTIFQDEAEAFGHKKYCDPCSQFKIDCKNGKCKSGDTKVNCNRKNTIDATEIENIKTNTKEVTMLVSDGNKKFFHGLNKCRFAGIFEGIRKDEWKCGEICGYNVCKPINVNDLKVNGTQNQNQIIIITAFVKLWVEYFFEDYKKIKHKISHCINSGNKSTCTNDCPNKCKCVKEWVEEKTNEWKTLKERFNDQYKNDSQIYPVRSILEELIPQIDVTIDKKNYTSLEELEKTLKCNGSDKSQNGTQKDIIECLLGNLKDKIETYPSSTSGSEQCTTPPSNLDDYTHTDDDDAHEKEKQSPKFCKDGVVPEKSKVPESEDDSTKTSESTKKGESSIEDIFKTCPYDNDTCNNYRNKNNIGCPPKTHHTNLNHWKNTLIKFDKGKSTDMNDGILIPPRRRQLCFRNIRKFHGRIDSEQKFREYFIADVYNEAKQLSRYYAKDNEKILEAIKNSFADYGNIVKGDDMLGDGLSEIIQKILVKLNEKKSNAEKLALQQLWENNKKYVWYVMLCGYKQGNHSVKNIENECTLPTTESEDQFLRWFQEWGKIFCTRKKELKEEVKQQCSNSICTKHKTIENRCQKACKKYSNFISTNQNVYLLLKSQYDKNYKRDKTGGREAHDYLKIKCKNGKCDCIVQNFIDDDKWEKPYETLDKNLKSKCECIKPKPTCTTNTAETEKKKEEENDQLPAPKEQTDPGSDTPPPLPTPSKPDELLPIQADQPFDPTILQTTIPFGIALALGSIAFLFLKKKTKSTIDLLRVINIPKSDYDIPTKLSPNRYIPYTSGKYRGKRYIYLEGDSGTDSGYTDHYSDITSSSESEYEELDINDIYAPRAPKYKTLIEVVLEPSGNNTTASGNNTTASGNNTTASGNNTTASDTQNDIQNDGIPSSKITDNEWNTLKDEFISQYLPNTEPNNNYRSGNSPTNTNITTTSRHNMEEKPFITSIHDRNLYTGEEISYNINMSTNSMDDPKYVSNNVYSGIDLINDTLSGNKHIDIYDEVLKRKENELFGTNHTKKNTSTNSVAKLTNSDPIHNQLELFHKWLDRHRDMCEKLKNDNERLAKLKEEWENETHSGDINSGIPSGKLSDIPSDNNIHSDIHPSDIHSGKLSDIPSGKQVLNTDVSIQIHMDNPKTTNEFTYVDSNPNQVDDTYVDSNPDNSSMDTILEDLEKYNEPYYDVQDDIYYDVHDHDASTVDSNAMDVPSKVQIEMDVNTKLVKEKYPISDVWDI
ncbi:erythrocyte membrane protein 1, PfEMP1 [Plasmodium falciparum 3D7]|uniref:Erythrocyte membrane protein 1, PfEMP1 n=2 Tax=Plasmodium falciparum TaxID=5833 RepID=Q8IBD8_PLAF7|nr:erythrocyte membrane protein 1, PfEMP1 [Plasmodium falciparum 3D7]PKC42246.1 erythrocyte membrane protein 1 [Plasmodium falciparum NF54]CAD51068.1 erythrocyte membrane protein 1, PfEMP1 [Plasmodium falciparum 3D7]|eukprot:XP_001349219.1 erythrocyte membrane protein 1, PfEMP1 [Plasmodium falciparum 3D7]